MTEEGKRYRRQYRNNNLYIVILGTSDKLSAVALSISGRDINCNHSEQQLLSSVEGAVNGWIMAELPAWKIGAMLYSEFGADCELVDTLVGALLRHTEGGQ